MATGTRGANGAPITGDGRSELERLERALHVLVRRLGAAPARTTHRGIVPSARKDAEKALDKAAYFLLSALSCDGPRRVSDVAGSLGLDVSTVSRELRKLEDTGLVARDTDPNDGRAVRLAVTGAGAAALATERERRYARLERALAVLSSERRAELVDTLEELSAALDTADGGPLSASDTIRPECRSGAGMTGKEMG